MADGRLVMIVVFDGMKLLDAAGPAEVFAEANRFGADYRIITASVDGHDVMTSIGLKFPVSDTIESVESMDTALVSGGDILIGRPLDPGLVSALATVPLRSRRIASICTGAFLLAEAGLLDGRRATTHWRHAALLQRAFPAITVEPDAIFVRDHEVFTSAGVSSGIDLALALVEDDYGSEVVREVARSLVVYLKRAGGQSQFSVFVESEPPPGSALRAATEAIAADPAADHSVAKLATRSALSSRQVTRLFHTELGTTPARYVEMIRIDAARASLDAGHTVAEAARMSGFGSTETLRRVFAAKLGVSPRAYRDRFRTAVRS